MPPIRLRLMDFEVGSVKKAVDKLGDTLTGRNKK
jgi:hypothetical protein